MTSTQLPPFTHHITVTSDDGKSVFQKPAPEPKTQSLGPGMEMAYLYSSPASFSIQKDTDLAYHQTAPSSPPLRTFPPAGATSIITLDIGPNVNDEPGNMHRTQTLDYLIVLEGALELTLDSGEKKIVRRGEMVIQRAPMHTWKNASKTESARMLAIAIGSEEAVEGGMEFAGQA